MFQDQRRRTLSLLTFILVLGLPFQAMGQIDGSSGYYVSPPIATSRSLEALEASRAALLQARDAIDAALSDVDDALALVRASSGSWGDAQIVEAAPPAEDQGSLRADQFAESLRAFGERVTSDIATGIAAGLESWRPAISSAVEQIASLASRTDAIEIEEEDREAVTQAVLGSEDGETVDTVETAAQTDSESDRKADLGDPWWEPAPEPESAATPTPVFEPPPATEPPVTNEFPREAEATTPDPAASSFETTHEDELGRDPWWEPAPATTTTEPAPAPAAEPVLPPEPGPAPEEFPGPTVAPATEETFLKPEAWLPEYAGTDDDETDSSAAPPCEGTATMQP